MSLTECIHPAKVVNYEWTTGDNVPLHLSNRNGHMSKIAWPNHYGCGSGLLRASIILRLQPETLFPSCWVEFASSTVAAWVLKGWLRCGFVCGRFHHNAFFASRALHIADSTNSSLVYPLLERIFANQVWIDWYGLGRLTNFSCVSSFWAHLRQPYHYCAS